jgi:vanillate/4-hydroxybenzoate decarboxylase subunit D
MRATPQMGVFQQPAKETRMDCPRCDHTGAVKFFEAPADKSWEMYRCERCDYVWRSTEREEVRNPRLYPPEFKLSEDQIAKMPVKPMIPPLKEMRNSEGGRRK